jgi:hypothetical protein
MNKEREYKVVVVDGLERGIRAVAADSSILVVVFAKDWSEVDRGRALARERGLENRMRVHHGLARSWARVA